MRTKRVDYRTRTARGRIGRDAIVCLESEVAQFVFFRVLWGAFTREVYRFVVAIVSCRA